VKIASLSVIYSLALYGLLSAFLQVQVDPQLINGLLQIPMVAGLIYLVLSLEDKRHLSAQIRETTMVKIVNDLLGVIVELSTLASSSRITSQEIQSIESYLKNQQAIDKERQ